MIITNHWLEESNIEKVKKIPTVNFQNEISPKYLIIHYTACESTNYVIDWFRRSPNQGNIDKICAHIIIDFDGTIIQLAPFNSRCNHAGYSCWDSVTGLNEHSIGIEIMNLGFCEKLKNGAYRTLVGTRKDGTYIYKYFTFSDEKIVKKNHKHKFWLENVYQYWFDFNDKQIDALTELAKLLIVEYKLTFILGHDDISPGRKLDPGPAFPWSKLRKAVFGNDDKTGNIFIVKSHFESFVLLRKEPSESSTVIMELHNGYEVGLIKGSVEWVKIYLVNDINDVLSGGHSFKIEGWIHESMLEPKLR